MAGINTPSATDDDQVAETAHAVETDIAMRSRTTGEAIRKMEDLSRNNIDQWADGTTEHAMHELSRAQRQELREVLAADAKAGKEVFAGNDLHLNDSFIGTHVQGQALVGGGQGGVELSSEKVVGLSDDARKMAAKDVTMHELSHATEQKPMHSVYTDREITSFDLHELRSEQAGAVARGKGEDSIREDAPPDYVAAHKSGNEMKQWGVETAQFHQRVAAGDSVGLQEDLIRGGLDRNKTDFLEVIQRAQERGFIYAQAAVHIAQERGYTRSDAEAVMSMAA
jgi:hypothetical protein